MASIISNYKRFFFNVGQGVGTITGTKFLDSNGNGVQDINEPGLQGWTIKLEPGPRYTMTDVSGNYYFSFVPPGTYTISEVLKPNWQQDLSTTSRKTYRVIKFRTDSN